jgi:Amidohydrolase
MIHDDLFLPEPEPREVLATIISVDDHLVEPADMFEERLPARLQDRAPRIVVDRRGHEVWEFDGQRHSQVGMNAVVGRRPETVEMEPFRFDQMRRGCFDVEARVHDMDLAGIWASLSFPSMITGFCGQVYSQCSDPDLGLATTRAFNDWVHDAWWQPHPERIIPLGITWLSDPELGAAEIRRNAERGFRAVTLPERPHMIGYPSIFDEYWAPILQACADTRGWDERPAGVLRRDFWFCTIDDPSTIDTRHAIGVDHIMVEVDYPHGDSTWPDTQAVIEAAWGHLPAAERRKLCCENAAALFRHPLPERVLPEGPST